MFGYVSDEFWDILKSNYGLSRPQGSDSLALSLYGDEIAVFDGKLCMCINFMSETSPHHKVAAASRFLICILPAARYYIANKINITLQALLRCVVDDLNKLYWEGACGCKAVVSSIRGDWKFLVQCLSLKYSASTNFICFRCPASKDLLCPFTDVSAGAQWRTQQQEQPVWFEEPALAHLVNFSLDIVAMDVLHCYHLGMGRDVVSSCLVMLLRTDFFPGRRVPGLQS